MGHSFHRLTRLPPDEFIFQIAIPSKFMATYAVAIELIITCWRTDVTGSECFKIRTICLAPFRTNPGAGFHWGRGPACQGTPMPEEANGDMQMPDKCVVWT